MTQTSNASYLTQEAYDRLKAELDELVDSVRAYAEKRTSYAAEK